jgi:hypothetical protein
LHARTPTATRTDRASLTFGHVSRPRVSTQETIPCGA